MCTGCVSCDSGVVGSVLEIGVRFGFGLGLALSLGFGSGWSQGSLYDHKVYREVVRDMRPQLRVVPGAWMQEHPCASLGSLFFAD